VTSSGPRWLSPPEIAAEKGVDVAKVLSWLKSGELVGYDLSERKGKRPRYKINPADLEAFLRRRQVQPPLPRPPKTKRLAQVPSYV
jgi:hypothetical protein